MQKESPEFSTTWCDSKNEFIPLGAECPKCHQGQIKQSNYYEGVYCPSCKWKWRLSKYAQESQPQKEEMPVIEEKRQQWSKELDQGDKILDSLKLINDRLTSIEEILGIPNGNNNRTGPPKYVA